MKRSVRLLVSTIVALGVVAGIAGAQPAADQAKKMQEIFTSPNQATNSDLAFWGDHAFVGYYTGDTGFPPGTGSRGGVRIFDISDPASPQLVRDFACDANQNDPIVWDRNGNGVADLLLVAVDRTMANPNCGAPPRDSHLAHAPPLAAHAAWWHDPARRRSRLTLDPAPTRPAS